MAKNHATLVSKAFSQYLSRLDAGGLKPTLDYLPYDFEDEICRPEWSLMGHFIVLHELQEVTNILNSWHGLLLRWHAWNEVLERYQEDEQWKLRREFLEPLVHTCLFHPSAARDTLTFMVTNAVHQLRIVSEKDYKDYLEGDVTAGGQRQTHLTRAKKEKRLRKILCPWFEGTSFMASLESIDDKFYRESTSDYRNRSSHAIGPRLAFGEVQFVTRQVVSATQLKHQPDGSFREESIPEKMSVCYGFGGTPPLDMEKSREENLTQYQRARTSYMIYRAILSSGMKKLALKD